MDTIEYFNLGVLKGACTKKLLMKNYVICTFYNSVRTQWACRTHEVITECIIVILKVEGEIILLVPVTVRREQSVKREKKTNKMQQSDVYYQLLSQHVSGIIIPIFRRTKTLLLHMVYCSGSAGCGW